MCGIVGIIGGDFARHDAITLATGKLTHRGPDDSGVWTDRSMPISLGHTRLSVLDPSPAGHQPMVSDSGRFVVLLNGEIYNHLLLRKQLGVRSKAWRGHSDTETMLACIEEWGIDASLRAAVGMFALALWDRKDRTLVLARDRFGEKPLYLGYIGNTLCFASELKAFTVIPGFQKDIDPYALSLLVRHRYIPAPHCIFGRVRKLLPATYMVFTDSTIKDAGFPSSVSFWSATETALEGLRNPLSFQRTDEAVAALEARLSQSVKDQMLSDVPLGVFLSGGIDSSTIAALMQSHSPTPIRTFAVGFREQGFDEIPYASPIARHLGTEHTELYVSHENALAVIPHLPTIYDEPFADASQIPTFLLAKLAREHVTVALSGDGGDELFGGYTRYFVAARRWRHLTALPLPIRQALSRAILAASPALLDSIYRVISQFIPKVHRWSNPGEKLHKGAKSLCANSEAALYAGLLSYGDPEALVVGSSRTTDPYLEASRFIPSLAERMMLLDASHYLPDDILVKVDRAAMSVGLETRIPMLDHRVFEFAWRLPLAYKVRGGVGKWLLRQVLYNYVPRELVDRPKMGFNVPLDIWLRGPLRDWAHALLSEQRLKQDGLFYPVAVQQKWKEHLAGTHDWHHHLWPVLMFQAWKETWLN